MDSERLKKQLDFLIEADKMKSLYRQTYIISNESRGASMREFEGEEQKYKRRENDAEHSFHLALFVIMLAEYANEPIDVLKAVKTVLIHDIVEIDAGDTYFFDDKGYKTKRDRETRAADRLFGLLPNEQRDEYRTLWEEFEAGSTPEARFASSVDRMQPMLLNYLKDGISWREHNVSYEQVKERGKCIKGGSEKLWEHMDALFDDVHNKGLLK